MVGLLFSLLLLKQALAVVTTSNYSQYCSNKTNYNPAQALTNFNVSGTLTNDTCEAIINATLGGIAPDLETFLFSKGNCRKAAEFFIPIADCCGGGNTTNCGFINLEGYPDFSDQCANATEYNARCDEMLMVLGLDARACDDSVTTYRSAQGDQMVNPTTFTVQGALLLWGCCSGNSRCSIPVFGNYSDKCQDIMDYNASCDTLMFSLGLFENTVAECNQNIEFLNVTFAEVLDLCCNGAMHVCNSNSSATTAPPTVDNNSSETTVEDGSSYHYGNGASCTLDIPDRTAYGYTFEPWIDPEHWEYLCACDGCQCPFSWKRCEPIEGTTSFESVFAELYGDDDSSSSGGLELDLGGGDGLNSDGGDLGFSGDSGFDGGDGSFDSGGFGPGGGGNSGGSGLDPFYPDQCRDGVLTPALCPGRGCGPFQTRNPCNRLDDRNATCANTTITLSNPNGFICTCSDSSYDPAKLCTKSLKACPPLNVPVSPGTWSNCSGTHPGQTCERLTCPKGQVGFDENDKQFDNGTIVGKCKYSGYTDTYSWEFSTKYFSISQEGVLKGPVKCQAISVCSRLKDATDYFVNICQDNGDLRAQCADSGQANTCQCTEAYISTVLQDSEALDKGMPPGVRSCVGSALTRSGSAWKRFDSLPEARYLYASCWMGTNYYIYGGSKGQRGEYNDAADLWEYDSKKSKWRIIYSNDVIAGRLGTFGAKIYCDEVRQRLIMFGGSDSEHFFDQLWYFYVDDLEWVHAEPESQVEWPDPRREFALAARVGYPMTSSNSTRRRVIQTTSEHLLLYVVGGYGEFGVSRDIYEIDIGPNVAGASTFYPPVATRFTGIPADWLGGQGLAAHFFNDALVTYGGLATESVFGITFQVVVRKMFMYSFSTSTWSLVNITNPEAGPPAQHNFGSALVGETVPESVPVVEPPSKGRSKKNSPLAKKGVLIIGPGTNVLVKSDVDAAKSSSVTLYYMDLNGTSFTWKNITIRDNVAKLNLYSYELCPMYKSKTVDNKEQMELLGFSVFGGALGATVTNKLYQLSFDSAKDIHSWSDLTKGLQPRQPSPRSFHCSVRFGSDMYMFGGVETDRSVMGDLWRMNMDNQRWQRVIAVNNGPPNRYRHACAPTAFRMVVYGGLDVTGTPLADLWTYNTLTRSWEQIVQFSDAEGIPPALYDHSLTTLWISDKPYVYLFGGVDDEAANPIQNSLFVWSEATKIWANKSTVKTWTHGINQTVRDMSMLSRAAHAATVYRTGNATSPNWLCVFGGLTDVGLDNGIYLYDPVKDYWSFRNVSDQLVPMKKAVIWTSGTNIFIQGGQADTLLNSDLYSGSLAVEEPAITSQAVFAVIPASYTNAGYLAAHTVEIYQNKAVIFGGYSTTPRKNFTGQQPVGKPRAVQNAVNVFISKPVCPLKDQSAQEAGLCVLCEAGSFANLTNATTNTIECASCPRGSYSVKSGAAVCTGCPPGFYSTLAGASQAVFCIACPEGKYANTSGKSRCDTCPDGTYCPLASQDALEVAAIGVNQSSTSTEMQPAPLVRYTEEVAKWQEYVLFAAIGVAACFFAFGLLMALIPPCQKVLRALDIYKDKHQPTEVSHVQQKFRRTSFGGIFSMVAGTVALLFFIRTLIPLKDNKQEVRALFGLVKQEDALAFRAKSFNMSINIREYTDVCRNDTSAGASLVGACEAGISVSVSGFANVGQDLKKKPAPVPLQRGNKFLECEVDPAKRWCKVTWGCKDCQANPKNGAQVTFILDHLQTGPGEVDRMYSQAIIWNVTTTSGVTLEGVDQISSLQGTILPSNSRLLRGVVPSIIRSSLTPTFFKDTDIRPNVEAQGYTAAFESNSTGSEVDSRSFSQTTGLRVKFEYSVFLSGLSVEWSTITPTQVLISAALGASLALIAPLGIAMVIFELVYIYFRLPCDKNFKTEYTRVKEVQRGRIDEAKKKLSMLTEMWKEKVQDMLKNTVGDVAGAFEVEMPSMNQSLQSPSALASDMSPSVHDRDLALDIGKESKKGEASCQTALKNATLATGPHILCNEVPMKGQMVVKNQDGAFAKAVKGKMYCFRTLGVYKIPGSGVCASDGGQCQACSALPVQESTLTWEAWSCAQCATKSQDKTEKSWHCDSCSFDLCEDCHRGIFGRQLMCRACALLFVSDGTSMIAKSCHRGQPHNLTLYGDSAPGSTVPALAIIEETKSNVATTSKVSADGAPINRDVFCTSCGLHFATDAGKRLVPETCFGSQAHSLSLVRSAAAQGPERRGGKEKNEESDPEKTEGEDDALKGQMMDLSGDVEIPEGLAEAIQNACVIA